MHFPLPLYQKEYDWSDYVSDLFDAVDIDGKGYITEEDLILCLQEVAPNMQPHATAKELLNSVRFNVCCTPLSLSVCLSLSLHWPT